MFEYSQHSLLLLIGIAAAGIALFGAIAVGPYGRRGLRTTLAVVSFAAFLGTVFWLVIYLGFIEERRSIEGRLSELRGQALSAGSALACLERTGDTLESACAQTLFATSEALAAASLYTAARLDLLIASTRYSGPRSGEFDIAVAALRRSLQQDPFGLTAHALVLREGCTVQRCESLAVFPDAERLRDNIRRNAFEANLARHAGGWRTRAASPAAPAGLATPALGPAGEIRAPIPDKYTLPSASSIPPVSIMDDEPPERSSPAPLTERAASQSTQPTVAVPPSDEAGPRRPPKRTNTPLSISPKQ